MEENEESFFTLTAQNLMTKSPKQISQKAKLIEAERIMTAHKVNSLLVTQNNNLLGIIQIYDFK